MTKRLQLKGTRQRDDEWPEVTNRFRKRHVFAGRTAFRKLRVMVDFELLEACPPRTAPTMRQLLTELLEHPVGSQKEGTPV